MRKGLGRLKTLIYRKPREEIQRMFRWGFRAYCCNNFWKREMESAAFELPVFRPISSPAGRPLSVWFLTGKKFWYQTAFCAWTIARFSNRSLIFNLVSDGSLSTEQEDSLRRLFPEGITIRKEEIHEKIEMLLPTDKFPILRQRWDDYVNIRKLIDVHLGTKGAKLVLDSDMLFFRRPDALLDWWDNCRAAGEENRGLEGDGSGVSFQSKFSPLLMTDCVESYGYSRSLMEDLAGAPIPSLLNVGICGLRSEDLNWEELEHWCQELVNREGTSYYLEQALVAMHSAKSVPTVMPADEYITYPSKDQVISGEGVLQHYVADSKPWYFEKAWKLSNPK